MTNLITLKDLYAKPTLRLEVHMMDVGYIAEALMKYGRAYSMTNAMSHSIGIDYEKLVESISFLCACHDIGKAHPNFLGKMYSKSEFLHLSTIYNKLKKRGLVKDGDFSGFRHERYSRELLKKYFDQNGYSINADRFANMIAYHHQGKSEEDFSDKIDDLDENWTDLHKELFAIVEKEWKLDKDFAESNKFVNGVNYSILSILITSDWIASGTHWAQLVYKNPQISKRDLAERFIKENELAYEPMEKRFATTKWNKAFKFKKNDLQKATLKEAKKNPSLMIIEYPCGGGKTEAALAAATKIGKGKSGIFIATPTMATAKGMTVRVNAYAKNANLGLTIPEFDSSILWSDEDMYKVPQNLWVSKSRHRMLYPFAVGTIDQILKTMLYYKYACIGLMGLADKVLIIDEVHAYDCYMLTELKVLLKWCRFLEIPVILLSATLPTVTKNQLLMAAGCKPEKVISTSEYPLITTYKDNKCKCTPVPCEGKTFKLNVLEVDDYDLAWRQQLIKNYNGCTAFIKGTIDNTWELYNDAMYFGLPATIFHGRDTLEHKEQKTLMLLDLLGKEKEHRPERMNLIATSIIEQSLDIDLDRMITCVAPIDLLIQRFGRVQRHSDQGTLREKETIDDPITVIIPKDHSKLLPIYEKEILNRTIIALHYFSELNTVTDAREIIDAVYDSVRLVNIPQQIVAAGFNTINSPDRSDMFINENKNYSRFSNDIHFTRFESYPTTSIAIVKPSDIAGINDDYNKVKSIFRKNIVGVADNKLALVKAIPIQLANDFLHEINFYREEDLAKENIILTENGLKWSNN